MLSKKALVIGLDCLTPQLVFNEYLDELLYYKETFKKFYMGQDDEHDSSYYLPSLVLDDYK